MYSLINHRINFLNTINFPFFINNFHLYSTLSNQIINLSNSNYEQKNKILFEENMKLKKKINDLRILYKNTINDFNNFQKIQEKEINKIKNSTVINLGKEICSIKDNFNKIINIIHSLKNGKKDENKEKILEKIFSGIKLMNKNLEKILIKNNIIEYIPELNSIFDPLIQEAIYKYQDKSKKDNTIGKVLSSGYKINNTILRPAKVAVIKNEERKLI